MITILSSPQNYTPSDNLVQWTFSSDQTTQPNFYFLITLRINGSVHSNHKIVPESSNAAKFDASDVVKDYCTAPPINAGVTNYDAGNYCKVGITIQEWYGDPPTDQSTQIMPDVTVWKSRLSNEDFADYDHSAYLPSNNGRWLTANPNHMVAETGENMWLCAITEGGGKRLGATLYDINGNVIASDLKNVDFTNIPIAQVKIDPDALKIRHGFTSSQIKNTYKYKVQIGLLSNYATETIYIDRLCYAQKTQSVYFLANLGSIELMRFVLLRTDKISVARNSFQRAYGRWNGTNFDFSSSNGEKETYLSSYDTSATVTSDWLAADHQRWLVYNLLPSPAVWLDDGGLKKVVVLDTESDIHNEDKDDPLFSQQVTLGYSAKNYSPIL